MYSPPELTIWHPDRPDTQSASPEAVEEEIFFAKDPHNYRYDYPDNTAEYFPSSTNQWGFWRQALIERRKLSSSADPPAVEAGPSGGLSSLFVHGNTIPANPMLACHDHTPSVPSVNKIQLVLRFPYVDHMLMLEFALPPVVFEPKKNNATSAHSIAVSGIAWSALGTAPVNARY